MTDQTQNLSAVEPVAKRVGESFNPWREFIENVISGDNYFRESEYRDLLCYIDSLYTSPPTAAAAVAAALMKAEEVCDDYDGTLEAVGEDDYQTGRARAVLDIKSLLRSIQRDTNALDEEKREFGMKVAVLACAYGGTNNWKTRAELLAIVERVLKGD